MNTTYTAPIESADAAEARLDWFDHHMPQWEEMTDPERFVSEDDLPVYDTSADDDRVSNEDWEAFLSDRW